MKLQFNKNYFIYFVFLFIIETLIAVYLIDGFIRFIFGDFLVIILLYCFVKSFSNLTPLVTGIGVLIQAFIIEFLQLINLLHFLNLDGNYLAGLILGSTFNVWDLVAYSLGILTVLIIENVINRNK